MGRRKRRNSDIDLTVEKIFDRRAGRYHDEPPSSVLSPDQPNPQPATGDDVGKSSLEESAPGNKKQKTMTEAERIEALKRKKQERKQRNKEKKEEKEHQAQEARKRELAAKKLREQKDEEAKKNDAKNIKDQPFTTAQKGVQYQDVVIGKGPPVMDRKKVRVAYTLRAKHRYGKILDSSTDFGFRLGRGDVIDGWDIGLRGMRQGGKRHLIIPPQAGYGQQNIGAGPGGILFFEVTILAC